MPQHGFRRPARTGRFVSVAAVALALVLGSGFVGDSITSAARSKGGPQLGLPWSAGTSWRLTGGPHSNSASSSKPWSSVDLAGPVAGASYAVRAARGGIVVRPCANMVRIRHDGGWMTGYYHLSRIKVRAGQRVARGQLLGYTSVQSGCGGSAIGPHLHFTLMRKGRPVSILDHDLGAWTVRAGSQPYGGCLVRNGQSRCAPGGGIYNDGSIGSR